MAIWIGKRPVFVVASCILFATCVWAQGSKSFDSLLASVVIGSFASGSTEALGAAIVNVGTSVLVVARVPFSDGRDRISSFSMREAPRWESISFSCLSAAPSALCVEASLSKVGEAHAKCRCGQRNDKSSSSDCGWVWFKRIMAIFTGVNFATVVLFAPETRFSRVLSIPTETDTSSTAIPDERPGEKVATDTAHEEECTASVVQPVPKRSYLQSLSLWSGTAQDGGILEIFIRPFALIVYPANFFAMISCKSLAFHPCMCAGKMSCATV